ncbi:unnamed protein product [Meloidogyne enterolobii]|uniref:Uncharacterized protein n=1 Tax=Meloidogyne enterolobii TaxID=390850 RepID=A0ACB0YS43_MELEN
MEVLPVYDAFPLTICYCVAFISISVVINIGTLISYRRHAKLTSSVKNNQQLRREKTEYKLLLYAILTFVGHAVMAFEQVNRHFLKYFFGYWKFGNFGNFWNF